MRDMEELISTVPEKETAEYLHEAFVCYGAGAYRACVVLTHIALFEGLRAKLNAVAPVNQAAKTIVEIIEPEADAQRVFEKTLIDKMKAGQIISQLEADILHQLNRQRNKAAHPSRHRVSAEEARFVFSEAVTKFLSQPIRQTSVLVDEICARLSGPNFFPAKRMEDVRLIVTQETENLDPAATPLLIKGLVRLIDGSDEGTADNAHLFLLGLADQKDPAIRNHMVRFVITPKSSSETDIRRISELIAQDPEILKDVPPASRLRLMTLLRRNLEETVNNKNSLYNSRSNPAQILARIIEENGEDFVADHFNEYALEVIDTTPTAPDFIKSIKNAPQLLGRLQENYRLEAGHIKFGHANAFARVLPGIDAELSDASSDEDAWRLLVAVTKAERIGAFDAADLAKGKFQSLPGLRTKALTFAVTSPDQAFRFVTESGSPATGLEEFRALYFDPELPHPTA